MVLKFYNYGILKEAETPLELFKFIFSTFYRGRILYTLCICISCAAAKSLQSRPTLCDPIGGSPPGSLTLVFSRQGHWSGLPFPSPMHESESEAAQSCPTLSDNTDCSLPGSSHGIFQARVLGWGAIAFSFNCWGRLILLKVAFAPCEFLQLLVCMELGL